MATASTSLYRRGPVARWDVYELIARVLAHFHVTARRISSGFRTAFGPTTSFVAIVGHSNSRPALSSDIKQWRSMNRADSFVQ